MSKEETSRRQQVAAAAALIVQSTRHTHYQHDPVVDPETGTYKLDCSEFVSYVLQGAAPAHYACIPKEPKAPCPRAFEYCDYLRSIVYDNTNGWGRSYEVDNALVYEAVLGWRRIARLDEVRPGDVIAWRFARWSPGGDTGHVAFVAEKPRLAASGVTAVRVYDSSALAHWEDSRERDGAFVSGVGMGTLMFHVNGSGAPIAVQFGPSDRFHSLPIVIGRLEPFRVTLPATKTAPVKGTFY
jgi:hypothetical protein